MGKSLSDVDDAPDIFLWGVACQTLTTYEIYDTCGSGLAASRLVDIGNNEDTPVIILWACCFEVVGK